MAAGGTRDAYKRRGHFTPHTLKVAELLIAGERLMEARIPRGSRRVHPDRWLEPSGMRIHWSTLQALEAALAPISDRRVWDGFSAARMSAAYRVYTLRPQSRARLRWLTTPKESGSAWRRGPMVSTPRNHRRHKEMRG